MFRPEYPRPQMVRTDWINLNGGWEYQTDRMASGTERKLYEVNAPFTETIEVPFCRESELSGIGDKEFCNCVWYRKRIQIPEAWAGKRVILHIGAADYRTTLWVDGKRVGSHIGGSVAFSFDMTPYISGDEAVITLRVQDNLLSGNQPGGKQSTRYYSRGCHYTRTTGIWQTVWMEAVEQSYVTGTRYYPDVNANTLTVLVKAENADGMTATATAFYEGKEVGKASCVISAKQGMMTLALSELHLWEVGNGRLYDLELTLGKDRIKSYFGMRSVGLKEGILYLNGKPVFQRLVLDQGFYPDGIWTAPSEEALINDIKMSMACGFNGARLHQKVFEPLFLYHCDRLGYLVWGEHGNWGLDISRAQAYKGMAPEWVEILERDFNHPAIIGWCPLNETQPNQDPDFVRFLGSMTRAIDPTRLYIDSSGWCHVAGVADIIDVHDYNQDPAALAATYEPMKKGEPVPVNIPKKYEMKEIGFPTFVSEYGGIGWDLDDTNGASWGYGTTPASPEEFIARFKGLSEAILFHPKMGAFCYTQLTDVEQEQNGMYTYDRRPKFDPAIFHAILSQKAAIEE